ncbi:MAG TPA: L,D-transpeptidase [Devosiaceae bacterium]|nr:L,D-transpeptidase [Devosiaceae bacterium]
MSRIKAVIVAAISVLLLAVLPVAAQGVPANWRVWDPVGGRWVHADGTPYVYNSSRSIFGPNGRTIGRTNPGQSSVPRQVVAYPTKYKPGTIVVETEQFRLYYVLPGGQAIAYGIGVGRDGFRWSGQHAITRKAEWPGWTPPAQMRKRVPDLPAYMPGGPDNPLGARALYIGSTLYRVHGTSEPWTIGQRVSSGCIRLTNDDIIDLYSRVAVGSLLVVHQ